ncbi:MAG: xanthine dehydrogenase family protein subunit M [Acidimicrobiaceae bacterium]|nr:xanthine dehydrogenase family protein subunit M [Acidimicrobiaceae bacterium]MCY4175874.1 xanthine dehydrogenase family protein subunit M [Acidimicrobiaceae bacterium]MCY4280588.1 xanthine dehydrogenase family protein subunit M [Acidimicrobiaceae bacterium]MCY4293342.1 xanthine dehydrogenase family protein subunit M [Acidimicrobiaceae bacterium]
MRYESPTTVAEAVELLGSEPHARVYAGATDLIPQIRSGRPEPTVMVDLKHIDRLCAITSTAAGFTVGAAAPTADICADGALAAEFPGLVEASGLIGSDQIQNRSSWGGNLANASPAADTPPSLVANCARAVIAGPDGERTVLAAEVATGPGRTSLTPGEFIVEFELDRPPARTADAYLRLTPRTEMDIAVVGAAVRISLDAQGRVADAAVALGAVAPTVVRVADAEAALIGREPAGDALAAVEAAAAAAADPIDDKRGTVAYRRQVAGVLARRAVATAAERAAEPQRGDRP